MSRSYDPTHLIRLNLYTVNAADIIQDALHLMNNMKDGEWAAPFLASHGTFGLENVTAYIIVLSNGELAVEAVDENVLAYRAGRPIISHDEALEVIKNCISSLVSINAAFYADPNNYVFDNRDLDNNPGDACKKKIEKVIHHGKLLLKFFNNEALTEEEHKEIVGRPLNPFEQNKLSELNDLLIQELGRGRKVSARGKIRTYLKKIQSEG